MFKHFLEISLRHLTRNRSLTSINIFGLALGMACCILVLYYVQDELSYDRHHEKANRTYRVALQRKHLDGEVSYASSPAPLARTLANDYPEVEHATRIYSISAGVGYEDHIFNEDHIVFAEPAFFDVFTIPILSI